MAGDQSARSGAGREGREEARARGREAEWPTEMPAPGWRDILIRTYRSVLADNVAIVSAGVAFFGLLAIFPGIATLISVAALVVDPATVEQEISGLTGFLPEGAGEIIRSQARKVTEGAGTGLTVAAAVALALTFYSASTGVRTLMTGINVAYNEQEKRSFLRYYLASFALTGVVIAGVMVAIALTVIVPVVFAFLGSPGFLEWVVGIARWPVLGLVSIAMLAVIYRFSPSRREPKWRWVTPGSLVATALWVVASVAFSAYVRNFGSYNETYGTLGGVIVLMTWLWISALVVLLGAELNAEMEHQTARDSTVGRDRPMGERGAVKADTLGETP